VNPDKIKEELDFVMKNEDVLNKMVREGGIKLLKHLRDIGI